MERDVQNVSEARGADSKKTCLAQTSFLSTEKIIIVRGIRELKFVSRSVSIKKTLEPMLEHRKSNHNAKVI